MGKFYLLIALMLPLIGTSKGIASVDSIIIVVANHIAKIDMDIEPITPEDFESRFYISDIINKQSVAKSYMGIYEFGIHGDDLPRWILLYDKNGYMILRGVFTYKSLGVVLDFLSQNKYSPEQSMKYIEALYRFYKNDDMVWEETIPPTQTLNNNSPIYPYK